MADQVCTNKITQRFTENSVFQRPILMGTPVKNGMYIHNEYMKPNTVITCGTDRNDKVTVWINSNCYCFSMNCIHMCAHTYMSITDLCATDQILVETVMMPIWQECYCTVLLWLNDCYLVVLAVCADRIVCPLSVCAVCKIWRIRNIHYHYHLRRPVAWLVTAGAFWPCKLIITNVIGCGFHPC